MNKDHILLRKVTKHLTEVLIKTLQEDAITLETKQQIELYLSELRYLELEPIPQPSVKLFTSIFQLIKNSGEHKSCT